MFKKMLVALLLCASYVFALTADDPKAWLVLYNENSQPSIDWADWYQDEWSIPDENMLALDCSTDERVHRDNIYDTSTSTGLFYDVDDCLDSTSSDGDYTYMKDKIMGIIVGYNVPGCYYITSSSPPLQGGGGASVSSLLSDMSRMIISDTYNNPYCGTQATRLTKATMDDDYYLVARIDGPPAVASVDDDGDGTTDEDDEDYYYPSILTSRAKTVNSGSGLSATDRIYYDYYDTSIGQTYWYGLKYSAERLNTTHYFTPPPKFRWKNFDFDTTNITDNAAFRFCWYDTEDWDTRTWSTSGARIFFMAHNSWGATTLRSFTDHDGRSVINSIHKGGYAASMGATGEPYYSNCPEVSYILWSLAEGRTLGEAANQGRKNCNYMYELVGDPFMQIPAWWPDEVTLDPDADGTNTAWSATGSGDHYDELTDGLNSTYIGTITQNAKEEFKFEDLPEYMDVDSQNDDDVRKITIRVKARRGYNGGNASVCLYDGTTAISKSIDMTDLTTSAIPSWKEYTWHVNNANPGENWFNGMDYDDWPSDFNVRFTQTDGNLGGKWLVGVYIHELEVKIQDP